MWRRQHQHQLGNQSCTTWAQTLAGKSKVSVDENKQPTTKSPVFCAPCAIFVMNRVVQVTFIITVARCFMSIQVTSTLSAIFQ